MNGLHRRHFLAGGLAAGAALAATGARAAQAVWRLPTDAGIPVPEAVPTPSVMGPVFQHDPANLLAIARRELEKRSYMVGMRDRVGLVDFARPSSEPRFHLVDLEQGRVVSSHVTHGRGSDPQHDGWLKSFSNDPGSLATSRGAYRTSDYYWGIHGSSMRLTGLEADNYLAEERAIVVHGAWYADPALVATQGKLGRSEGCFVFAEAQLPEILYRLGPGRLLFADRLAV